MNGFYRNVFFRDVDMDQFDFIGRIEAFDVEIVRLGSLIGIPVRPIHENVNPNRNYRTEVARLETDRALMADLHDILGAEIAFYDRWAGR
jgi:hypothetical protein